MKFKAVSRPVVLNFHDPAQAEQFGAAFSACDPSNLRFYQVTPCSLEEEWVSYPFTAESVEELPDGTLVYKNCKLVVSDDAGGNP